MTPLQALLATRPSAGVLTLRVTAGVIFVAFSIGKFTRHDAESDAFERYGIPVPEATTYLVGVLEFFGGLLLLAGFLTRPAALALAVNMLGAISTAGRIDGGAVHLGLAPALLAAMLVLVWAGGGARSIDGYLAGRLCQRPTTTSP